ncbi:MAG: PAS domain S-box protein, partial [Desulfatitalea sp.]|nr:PAS domain S-box protein [Desulfatitalea sp.]
NVDIRLGSWSERMEALKDGKIDVMQGMFYSSARGLHFDFTQAHIVGHYVAVVRQGEGPAPERVDAIEGKRIVVERGDIMHDLTLEHGMESQVAAVDDQETALRELSAGKHDCALVPRVTALFLIEKHGWTNLELGKKPFLAAEYCYAVGKGRKALLAQFGEGLKALENSGEYRRIYDKWLGVYKQEPVSFMTAMRYSALVIIPLLAVLLAAFAWTWSLRRQVAEKTKALQESLDRFRYVFEAANVGKSITLPTGEINANRAFAEFLGYMPDELKGIRWQNLTPPEDIETSERAIAPMLSGKKDAARFEKRYVHKSGEQLWADVSVAIRRDADGTPLFFMTTAVDITERKRYQLRIEHLNQVLRAIRDVNQLMVHERDRDRLIREGCRLLVANRGYPSVLIVLTDDRDRPVTWAMEGLVADSEEMAALLGQGVLPGCCGHARAEQKVLLVDDRQQVCGDCPIAATCVESQSLCAPLTHDGATFGYMAAAAENHLVVDAEELSLFSEMAGDFAYALNVIKLEVAHRDSESRFRAIVENAPEPIFIQAQMRFAYLNPKALDFLGAKDPRQLLGTLVMERFHPDFREQVKQRIKTLNEDRQSVKELLELKFLRLDGSSVWGETTGQPIVYEGQDGALVFVRDISVRKHHEQEREKLQSQLIQAQKMESVGRLAGGVAHDYNNMLSVIMGFTELALDKVKPDDPLRGDLNEVLNAARRSTDITRQLLAFARRQTIDPKMIDLNEIVESMLKMLRRLIGEDIDLSWQPGPGRMPVFMDPSQLDQLLANLCVNARDAIGGVGKLTIETDHVRFDEEYCADHAGFIPGEFMLLAVSDDGCGMDKQTLDNVFEPFFTTKTLGEGTGLGLSTVFGIVKQNGGFINVYSEPEKGTTFKIYLPP